MESIESFIQIMINTCKPKIYNEEENEILRKINKNNINIFFKSNLSLERKLRILSKLQKYEHYQNIYSLIKDSIFNNENQIERKNQVVNSCYDKNEKESQEILKLIYSEEEIYEEMKRRERNIKNDKIFLLNPNYKEMIMKERIKELERNQNNRIEENNEEQKDLINENKNEQIHLINKNNQEQKDLIKENKNLINSIIETLHHYEHQITEFLERGGRFEQGLTENKSIIKELQNQITILKEKALFCPDFNKPKEIPVIAGIPVHFNETGWIWIASHSCVSEGFGNVSLYLNNSEKKYFLNWAKQHTHIGTPVPVCSGDDITIIVHDGGIRPKFEPSITFFPMK